MSAASGGKMNTVLSYILNFTDAHRGRTKTVNTNDKPCTEGFRINEAIFWRFDRLIGGDTCCRFGLQYKSTC